MTIRELTRELRAIDRKLLDLCPWQRKAADLHRRRVRVVAELERRRGELGTARGAGGGAKSAAR